jgi:hypothetical protein
VITFNAEHVKKIYTLPDNTPYRTAITPIEEYQKYRNIPVSIVNE